MRIHEVLDACVEYVAYEGVLGSDVLSLQQHLARRDSSLDATSFAYLYTLLCQHPSIRIVISTYPLPSTDQSVQLGSAPLPKDYSAPDSALDVDFDRLYRQGKRGRELAFHLAGEEHKTSKEAVAVKRAEQERNRIEKKQGNETEQEPEIKNKKKKGLEQILGEDGSVLFSYLEDDDAGLGGEVVEKTDLAGLAEKWGSRLRIRCTDDEIYYRLTGSHQRVPKFTLPVMHTLQLAARSRDKGITAIELGPMIGASQGSLYYYMKVLVDQGICAKVPAVLHGSITNLLIFHPFLEMNENYRAIKKLGPAPAEVVEEEEEEPAFGDSSSSGFDFRAMTEQELMTGHIVKERLIQLLDHPALQNHLLKASNLLVLIGWKDKISLRHRRAIPRHIAALVMDGVVERLEVGPRRVDCLRLTKYNPDYKGPVIKKDVAADEVAVTLYQPQVFNLSFGTPMNRTLERQIIDAILASGEKGVTYMQLREATNGTYKRAIEFFLVRSEDSWHTPQLGPTTISSVMESASKERRLRVFSTPAYRLFMTAAGHAPDDAKHPALTEEAGRWADLDNRDFASDVQDFWQQAERVVDGSEPRKARGRPRKSKPGKARSETPELPNKKKAMLYSEDSVQVRGRPRKYIHVVDEEGKVRRMIIGQVHPHPDIPPVLIWIASKKLLVPAPESYSGLGKPPNVTAAQLQAGHSPKWFEKFPKFVNKSKGTKGGKRKAKGKEEDVDTGDEEEEDAPPKKKSKKKASLEEIEQEVQEERPKRSSRLSKVASAHMDIDELEEDGGEIEAMETEDTDFVIDPQLLAEVPDPVIDPQLLEESPDPIIDPQLLAEPPSTSPYLAPPTASPGPSIRSHPRSPIVTAASPLATIPLPLQAASPASVEFTPFEPTPISQARPSPIPNSSEFTSVAPAGQKKRKRKSPPPPASAPPPKAAKKKTPKAKKAAEPAPPTPTAPATSTANRSRATQAQGRVDLPMIRRNNELVEVLRANGGVLTDSKFLNAHHAWTYKVAGTDAPFAPTVGYKMDRRIFKTSTPVLEAEGKVKQTICSIPTTTGRWIQQQVLWLAETPKPEVDAYISSLAEATISSSALVPKKGRRTRVEDQAFTEARLNGQSGFNAKAIIIKNGMRDDTPAAIRRNALLKQPGVAATLLGYISGRWMRVWRFFEVLVQVLEAGSSSKESDAPYIFALPLIFEDIPIAAFHECIYTTTYDEDLDEWMSDPENRKTPLREVPARFRPSSGGFAGAQCKAKYRTILTTLCHLGVLSPLNPSAPATADFSISPELSYKRTKHISQATHFVVHAHAPIYHIAGAQPGLLGLLPISTTAERDFFWTTTRSACLTRDVKELPALSFDAPIGLPLTAHITEMLELDADMIRMMRSPARWRADTRLLEEQRDAIDSHIDWRRGEVLLADEEIEMCAYENALTVKFLREELKRRATQAKERAWRVAKKDEEAAKALKKKREKNQRDLRDKLAEIRAAAKKEWEDRILRACQAVGTECTRELVTFVTHHTLSIPNRAKLSDKAIEDAVRLGLRVQQAQLATSEVKQKRDIWERQAAPSAPVAGQRRRHVWTPHEDELLIDVEAIIRARSRGRIRGRAAASQVFPDIGHQSLLNRLKKLLSLPGKQQYFDRLEQAWHEIWMAHRGIELVDEHPEDTSSFDLKHHVEFLRSHINKSNLRHGYTEDSTAITKVPDLPSESQALLRESQWTYGKMDHRTLISVHEIEISDESKLAGYALTPLRLEDKVHVSKLDRKKGIMRACLKMIVSTANDVYDPAAATAFLAPFPTPERVIEINSLVDEKVFIRQHSAAHTQRHFTYTSVWHGMTDGLLSTDLAGEAKKMRAAVAEGEVKWSTICTGGDIAALLEMTSDGTVDIEFDLNDIRPIRYLRNTYNTRSLDDDAFEFDLTIKQKASSPPNTPRLPLPHNGPTLSSWSLQPEDVHVAATHLLDLVHAAGRDGLTRIELQEQTGYDPATLNSIFASLAAESPADVFWAGYDTARLISVEHWFDWTAGNAGGVMRVRPRRWTDIFGGMIKADWEKCLACVTSHIMTKPGILLSELRSRLSPILDRMELVEVIQYLEEAGTVRRGWAGKDIVPPVEAISLYEETQVGYWPNKSWT